MARKKIISTHLPERRVADILPILQEALALDPDAEIESDSTIWLEYRVDMTPEEEKAAAEQDARLESVRQVFRNLYG